LIKINASYVYQAASTNYFVIKFTRLSGPAAAGEELKGVETFYPSTPCRASKTLPKPSSTMQLVMLHQEFHYASGQKARVISECLRNDGKKWRIASRCKQKAETNCKQKKGCAS
jgi:hypothetical protein